MVYKIIIPSFIFFAILFAVIFNQQKEIIEETPKVDLFAGAGENIVKFWTEDNFYTGIKKAKEDDKNFQADIIGGVIPHHLLVSNIIANFFENLSKQKPKTIIIVGPNHNNLGSKNVVTGINDWTTKFGDVKIDREIVEGLINLGIVEANDEILSQEHSVSSFLPFISYYMPGTKIVPVVLNHAATLDEINQISNFLSGYISSENVVVASIDFSHYLTAEQATINDKKTADILKAYNYENILKLGDANIDSPVSIVTLMKAAKSKGADDFNIWYHTNSSEVIGDYNGEVTSYFSLLFYDRTDWKSADLLLNKVNNIKNSITVTFAGDIMVDRYIRKVAEKESYDFLFKNVKGKLSKSDLVVGNLEGPVTNYESIYKTGSHPNNYTFTFDQKIIESLKKANIKTVFLDNNHILNYGESGLEQTIENLQKGGINYFGLPYKDDVLYKTINGIDLAFISYNEFIVSDLAETIKNIKIANAKSDHVIIFTHWGNEYEKVPAVRQVSLAHQFIDSGADMVIGTHPHVIQQKEKYKGKYIYYSLGNFIFDQYFNEDVKCGAVVTFKIDKQQVISVEEDFISLDPESVVNFSDCATSVEFVD